MSRMVSGWMAMFLVMCVSITAVHGQGAAIPPVGVPWACQILDNPYRPAYEGSVMVTAESDFKGYGKSGFIELNGFWNFAFYRDVLAADLDMTLDFDFLLPLGSAGVHMPYQLVRTAVDAGMTWRYVDGMALQFRAAPGLYSDLETFSGGGINCPLSGFWIQSFSPTVSGMAGLRLRPGFDDALVPVVALAWDTAPFRVHVGFPETQATWFVNPDWRAYAGLDWRSDTYAIKDDDVKDRDEITLKGFRGYVGTAYRYTDELQLLGEIGSAFDRSVKFDVPIQDGASHRVDVDNGLFVRVGLAGPF